jgi:hypothetical protein
MAKGQRLQPVQIVTLLLQMDVLITNGKTLSQTYKSVARVEQGHYLSRKI